MDSSVTALEMSGFFKDENICCPTCTDRRHCHHPACRVEVGLIFHSSTRAPLLPEGGAVTAACTSRRCCLGDVHITFSALCFAVRNGGVRGAKVSAYPGKITWLRSECARWTMTAIAKSGVIKLSHPPFQLHVFLPRPPARHRLPALKRPSVAALMAPWLRVFS